jgi:hypothetical protein
MKYDTVKGCGEGIDRKWRETANKVNEKLSIGK